VRQVRQESRVEDAGVDGDGDGDEEEDEDEDDGVDSSPKAGERSMVQKREEESKSTAKTSSAMEWIFRMRR
jgi:hypothetical protein